MSSKELLLLCYIFLKSLFSGTKALIKAGGIWFVAGLIVVFFVVPSIVEKYNLKDALDVIFLLFILFVVIRFVIRLVKKDKTWGSLGNSKNRSKAHQSDNVQ